MDSKKLKKCGDELPEISKQTKERALELFDEWENGPSIKEDLTTNEAVTEAE